MSETPRRRPGPRPLTFEDLENGPPFHVDPKLAQAVLTETAEATAREYDGLQVDPDTGEFRRSGLVAGWTIEGGVRVESGDLVLTWLGVRPDGPDERVTSRLLRSIPVAVLLHEVRQRLLLADAAKRTAYLITSGQAPSGQPLEIGPRPGGRRRIDDRQKQALLRRVAVAYLAEQGAPGVYARLAKRFRRSQEEIKTLVRAARADEWLSGAVHGARGAAPGPRLLRDEKYTQEGKG